MKRKGSLLFIFLLPLLFSGQNISAQEIKEISVIADKPGVAVQPALSVNVFIINFKIR